MSKTRSGRFGQAGSVDRVISRNDALRFEKYPRHGRVADFKLAPLPDL
jgi:hypothetical protein